MSELEHSLATRVRRARPFVVKHTSTGTSTGHDLRMCER